MRKNTEVVVVGAVLHHSDFVVDIIRVLNTVQVHIVRLLIVNKCHLGVFLHLLKLLIS